MATGELLNFPEQPARVRALVVDDDAGDRVLVTRALCQCSLEVDVEQAASGAEATERLAAGGIDILFLDYLLPGEDAVGLVEQWHAQFPDTALVMVTGQGDELVAAAIMRRGAADYIPKSLINQETVKRITANSLDKLALRRRLARQQALLLDQLQAAVDGLGNRLDGAAGLLAGIRERAAAGDAAAVARRVDQLDAVLADLRGQVDGLPGAARSLDGDTPAGGGAAARAASAEQLG